MSTSALDLSNVRAYVRRELVFLALGTMDVCIITPVYAALLAPLINVKPLGMVLALLAAILLVHYLARLSFSVPLDPTWRSVFIGLAMLVTGLLAVHQVLYPQMSLWRLRWLGGVLQSLRQYLFAQDLLVFFLAVFLWWRGLVLAQRRLVSASVAFRFRLGVVLLAATSGIAGSALSWPYHHVVFLFFFASLLGIALARAEEVGQQHGGRQSPFSMSWLATLVAASTVVLVMAAGLTSLLTGETIGRILTPVLRVLQILLFVVIYIFAWLAQLVIEPLLAILQQYEIGRALEDVIDRLNFPAPPTEGNPPSDPLFTPDQLAAMRLLAAVAAAAVVLLIVAISLYRLRARSPHPSNEERESVWEGVQLRDGLGKLLRRGRRRLSGMADALSHSYLRQVFAALTIRRIYAHLASLAAKEGYPRARDETPYDYLPTLKTAFPESRREVTQITESYVAVHYGELPERQEDLSAIRSAWQEIQRKASSRPRSQSREKQNRPQQNRSQQDRPR
jgi:hypothetical protein